MKSLTCFLFAFFMIYITAFISFTYASDGEYSNTKPVVIKYPRPHPKAPEPEWQFYGKYTRSGNAGGANYNCRNNISFYLRITERTLEVVRQVFKNPELRVGQKITFKQYFKQEVNKLRLMDITRYPDALFLVVGKRSLSVKDVLDRKRENVITKIEERQSELEDTAASLQPIALLTSVNGFEHTSELLHALEEMKKYSLKLKTCIRDINRNKMELDNDNIKLKQLLKQHREMDENLLEKGNIDHLEQDQGVIFTKYDEKADRQKAIRKLEEELFSKQSTLGQIEKEEQDFQDDQKTLGILNNQIAQLTKELSRLGLEIPMLPTLAYFDEETEALERQQILKDFERSHGELKKRIQDKKADQEQYRQDRNKRSLIVSEIQKVKEGVAIFKDAKKLEIWTYRDFNEESSAEERISAIENLEDRLEQWKSLLEDLKKSFRVDNLSLANSRREIQEKKEMLRRIGVKDKAIPTIEKVIKVFSPKRYSQEERHREISRLKDFIQQLNALIVDKKEEAQLSAKKKLETL